MLVSNKTRIDNLLAISYSSDSKTDSKIYFLAGQHGYKVSE